MGSASITLKNKPGTTSATFNYSASGFVKPADKADHRISYHGDDKNGQEIREKRTYSSLSYSWSFTGGRTSSSRSGEITITGLNAGSKGWFGGTVTVTYTETITTTTITWSTPIDEEGKEGKKQTDTSTSTTTNTHTETASDGLNYWTKPTTFSFGVTAEGIIGLTLSAAKVRAFGKQVGQYQRWSHQSDSYSDKTYDVSSGDIITATLYNKIADDVGIAHVAGGLNGTIITAKLWNDLANAAS